MTHGGAAVLRVRRRLAQIADRLDELRASSDEASGPPPAQGLERERLVRAASRAGEARVHAAEAARLASEAYLRSAEVHERVAHLYDRLVADGTGDTIRYQREAERHRSLAAKDRAVGARANAAR